EIMKAPTVHLIRIVKRLVACGAMLSTITGHAFTSPEVYPQLIPGNKPSAHDGLAFISSVANRVAIVRAFVYVADGYTGLSIYSLSDAAISRLIGEYQTGEYTRTVRVSGGPSGSGLPRYARQC